MTAPEPYTLPSAVALLVVGLLRLRRDPAVSTMRALGPGLALATVPSLLWVLEDPLTLRAVLLGAGCLGLVLVGALLRWNAPLLVGATVGTLVVLREVAPYAVEVPQWILIGLAGTLLTVVGVTWERRLRDLQRPARSWAGCAESALGVEVRLVGGSSPGPCRRPRMAAPMSAFCAGQRRHARTARSESYGVGSVVSTRRSTSGSNPCLSPQATAWERRVTSILRYAVRM